MKKAFSLVELLVVLGIVAILAGIGFASTLRSNEQKKITESAETIRQYFMQAKSYAQAGKKDCSACGATGGVCGNGDNPMLGWRVTINTASPPEFEMHGECAIVAAPTPTPFFRTGQKKVPTRVTVTGPVDVLFKPRNEGTNLAVDVTITINSTMTLLTQKSFVVKTSGEITAIQ